MALYEKKLHIRKNGVVTDINLWTESGEAGTPALHIRDGVNLVHARLGEVTDGLASDLRVRKDGVVYAVLKNRWVTINIVQSANQTITVYVDGVPHTESFAVPYGTAFTAGVTAAAGFSPGAISMASGVAESDVTISATPAASSVPTGGTWDMHFAVPQGVTVVKISLTNVPGAWDKFVGVAPGKGFVISVTATEEPDGNGGAYYAAEGMVYRGKRTLPLYFTKHAPDESGSPISPGTYISWSPEINAHGPTDGSVA